MDNIIRPDSYSFKDEIFICEKNIRKIVKGDGDTPKHFENEIIGYKAYAIHDMIGKKYFNNDTKNFILRIRYEDLMYIPERYFIFTKLRAKAPVLYFEGSPTMISDKYKSFHYVHYDTKYRAMCIVNDDIIDFNGNIVKKFPKYFRRDLVMSGPMIIADKTDYRKVRMHRYVFPDWFAINKNECDHGISFFKDYESAFRFIEKMFYCDCNHCVLDASHYFSK